jgi:hypothetical protein
MLLLAVLLILLASVYAEEGMPESGNGSMTVGYNAFHRDGPRLYVFSLFFSLNLSIIH